MRYKKRKRKQITYMLIILFGVSSCIPAKKINYLQNKSEDEIVEFTLKPQQYKVQSGDNLYIKLSSFDPETAQILEPVVQGFNSNNDSERRYKNVYNINTKGYVNIPQVGDIYVKNMDLEQVRDTINSSMSKYFQQINVQVRLADAYVTILGEIERPGRYMINFDDKIAIFDLLGNAGDLTKHANRTNLKIVRKSGENTVIIHIDLTDKKILENENFYLMPNDIIYVEQLNAVFWDKESFPFFSSLSIILSTTTSILVIFAYLRN